MSKKIKLTINGDIYELPKAALVLKGSTQWDDETYIQMRAKYCASIIKQYVKKNFPNLVCSATSDVYSGGSSVRVNVCKKDGSKVDPIDFQKIETWKGVLQGGTFNGMIDMYEMREDSPTTDNGTPLKYFPSYIFIENKPNWGSKEYWIKEWNEWCEISKNYTHQNDNTQEYIDKVVQKGGWLSWNKEYMSKSVLKNIDSIMGCV